MNFFSLSFSIQFPFFNDFLWKMYNFYDYVMLLRNLKTSSFIAVLFFFLCLFVHEHSRDITELFSLFFYSPLYLLFSVLLHYKRISFTSVFLFQLPDIDKIYGIDVKRKGNMLILRIQAQTFIHSLMHIDDFIKCKYLHTFTNILRIYPLKQKRKKRAWRSSHIYI